MRCVKAPHLLEVDQAKPRKVHELVQIAAVAFDTMRAVVLGDDAPRALDHVAGIEGKVLTKVVDIVLELFGVEAVGRKVDGEEGARESHDLVVGPLAFRAVVGGKAVGAIIENEFSHLFVKDQPPRLA
jgi:hypothetical protein